MAEDFLEPMTDGLLTMQVEEPVGTPRDDATVLATVYGPLGGAPLATNVSLVARGASSGLYDMTWSRDWTTASGKGVPGEYLVVITSTRGTPPDDAQAVTHVRVPVRWADDS
jgi:hypothetical protein